MNSDYAPKFAIIGAGNLGASLAHCLTEHGYQVKLGSRRSDQHLPIFKYVNNCTYVEAVLDADFVFLTVPDDAIESTCTELSTYFSSESLVMHCSGALTSNSLQSAKSHGCSVASAHPLNTFPSPEAGIKTLQAKNHNTALYYEGDQVIKNTLIPIFESIGFRPYSIDANSKALYHAACVFSCNLTTALMEVSLQTAEAAQLDRQEFWHSIQPLLNNTLVNIGEHGTAAALSGPIARGDVNTVAKQTEVLADLPNDLSATYRDLSKHALSLAMQNSKLTTDSFRALAELLNGAEK